MKIKHFKQSLSCIDFVGRKKLSASLVLWGFFFPNALDQLRFKETHRSSDWS